MNRILKAQREFVTVLVVTVCINVLVYFTWEAKQLIPPPPVRQKVFMAMESTGRLGNLMFQYASLIGIAHTNQVVPAVLDSSHLLDVFQLTAAKSPNLRNTLGIYIDYLEFDKKANTFDANVTLFGKQNVLFYGYYQSWKYFENVSNLVRKEFKFCDNVLNRAKDIHSRVYISQGFNVIDRLTIVGIHVRRGDFLVGHYNNFGYTVPDREYYEAAMKFFMNIYKNVAFLVCTVDESWSRENIIGDNVYYSSSYSDGVDMAVLSMCDHVIVSVGSFGWWGAWLANGTTIYYSQWPRVGSDLEKMVTKEDYFFKNWIPLP